MNKKELLKELKRIFNGIESDNFTRENLHYLMEDIKKKGLNCNE